MIVVSTRTAAADCPVQVHSVEPAGRASSGAFFSYEIKLDGASAGKFDSVTFDLKLSDGTTDKTTWRNVALVKGDYPDAVPTTIGTFDRRTADVIAIQIEIQIDSMSGGVLTTVPECAPAWVRVGGLDDMPWELAIINERTHPFDPNVEDYYSRPQRIVDAEFINRVEPDYPAYEEDQFIQGDVTIRITVGSDGSVTNAEILKSSQDDAMDSAAASAALSSTFRPATKDGKPYESAYLIIYNFRVPSHGKDVPKSTCPLTAADVSFANAGQPGAPDWYDLDFDATRADIASATIALAMTDGTHATVAWPAIAVPPLDAHKTAWVSAAMPWVGADIATAWVASVTHADGTVENCAPYFERTNRTDTTGTLARTNGSLTTLTRSVTQVRRDGPVVRNYASFPQDVAATDTVGAVNVDVFVDDTGKVVGAILTSSSKNQELDKAAFSAALKNRYAPVGGVPGAPPRIFLERYAFEDQPS